MLHRAARDGHMDLVELLLAHGARACAKDTVSTHASGVEALAFAFTPCPSQYGDVPLYYATDSDIKRLLTEV